MSPKYRMKLSTIYSTNDKWHSVQFSCSVVSDSLWPHESQHARPPCPSPTHRVHSDSHTLSQWCHPAISSSVVPFSSCPYSLPASESFPMSQLFAWGGQSIGVSASASYRWLCTWIFNKSLNRAIAWYNQRMSSAEDLCCHFF